MAKASAAKACAKAGVRPRIALKTTLLSLIIAALALAVPAAQWYLKHNASAARRIEILHQQAEATAAEKGRVVAAYEAQRATLRADVADAVSAREAEEKAHAATKAEKAALANEKTKLANELREAQRLGRARLEALEAVKASAAKEGCTLKEGIKTEFEPVVRGVAGWARGASERAWETSEGLAKDAASWAKEATVGAKGGRGRDEGVCQAREGGGQARRPPAARRLSARRGRGGTVKGLREGWGGPRGARGRRAGTKPGELGAVAGRLESLYTYTLENAAGSATPLALSPPPRHAEESTDLRSLRPRRRPSLPPYSSVSSLAGVLVTCKREFENPCSERCVHTRPRRRGRRLDRAPLLGSRRVHRHRAAGRRSDARRPQPPAPASDEYDRRGVARGPSIMPELSLQRPPTSPVARRRVPRLWRRAGGGHTAGACARRVRPPRAARGLQRSWTRRSTRAGCRVAGGEPARVGGPEAEHALHAQKLEAARANADFERREREQSARSGLLLRAGLHAQVRQRNLQSRHAEGMQKRKAALRPKRFELRAEVERLGMLIDEAQDRLEDSAKRADLLAGRVQDAHDHEHQRSQFRDLREEAIAVEREERARRSRFDAVLREARVRALAERPLYAKNPTLLDVAADDAWAEACFLEIPVEAWPEFCLVLLSGLGSPRTA